MRWTTDKLRRKLEEALDHINAVRELLSKPIPAKDAKRYRELDSGHSYRGEYHHSSD